MFNRSHLTLGLSMIAILIASSCSDLPPRKSQDGTSRNAPLHLSKATWLQYLPTSMSDEFCSSNTPLMRCYSLSNDDCHRNIEEIAVQCGQSYENDIPPHLLRADMETWGGKIGECTKSGALKMIETHQLTPLSESCREETYNM